MIAWNKIKHLLSDLPSRLYYINREHFGYDLYPKEDISACLLMFIPKKTRVAMGGTMMNLLMHAQILN